MALKFRRGTTAQQSGSLAFGEPYVNTTLGTLIIGGADGDIVLSSTGTGSTGTFGAISGSGLDITGNARIGGDLIVGGEITIGDASADTVNVVASLSSSLIPSNDNAFTIGSSTKRYSEVHTNIITASVIEIASGSWAELRIRNTTTDLAYHVQNTAGGNFSIHNEAIGSSVFRIDSGSTLNDSHVHVFANLYVTKSLYAGEEIAAATGSFGIVRTTNTISGSIVGIGNVSAYSASVDSRLIGLSAYTSSNNSENTTQNTRLTALESSASTALSTNNSQDVSVTSLNTFSSSALTRLTALEVETTNLEAFTSSINTTIKNKLNVDGVISGSSQITLSSTTGFTTYSTSVDSRIATEKGRVDAILSAADADKDTFAEIVTLINSVDTTNDTVFASFYTASVGRLNNLELTSASVNTSVSNLNSFTSSINTTIKTQLDVNTVVSGSSQVIGILSSLNTYTGSNDTTNTTQNTRLTALEASASTALSTNNTQDTSVSNLNSFTSSINTTIKNKLNADGVVSGSSQITLGSASGNIALSTQTTGDYVASLVAGTGVTLSNNSGEGATPTIAIGQAVATSSSPTFAGLTINGAITATGDITAYYSSDRRYKNNIQIIPNALEKVSKLNGVTWEWNDDVNEVTKQAPKTGLIAQEVLEVLPEVVKQKEDGFLGLDYAKMIGLLVEAIKEQQSQIEELKSKLGYN